MTDTDKSQTARPNGPWPLYSDYLWRQVAAEVRSALEKTGALR
jgi:hypothetical protein